MARWMPMRPREANWARQPFCLRWCPRQMAHAFNPKTKATRNLAHKKTGRRWEICFRDKIDPGTWNMRQSSQINEATADMVHVWLAYWLQFSSIFSALCIHIIVVRIYRSKRSINKEYKRLVTKPHKAARLVIGVQICSLIRERSIGVFTF